MKGKKEVREERKRKRGRKRKLCQIPRPPPPFCTHISPDSRKWIKALSLFSHRNLMQLQRKFYKIASNRTIIITHQVVSALPGLIEISHFGKMKLLLNKVQDASYYYMNLPDSRLFWQLQPNAVLNRILKFFNRMRSNLMRWKW